MALTPSASAPHRRQLYLDCDGVLADFDGAFLAEFGMDSRAHEHAHGEGRFWQDLSSWSRLDPRGEPQGWYRALPLLPQARLLLEAVAHLRPIILTGLPQGGWAEAQKIAWAREHFPGVPIQCCLSAEKYLFCRPGDVLVDDWLKYRDLWTGAGGVFIHYPLGRPLMEVLRELQTSRLRG